MPCNREEVAEDLRQKLEEITNYFIQQHDALEIQRKDQPSPPKIDSQELELNRG